MGKVDTVMRGAADILSAGLADEISAGGDALFNPVFGTGNDGDSFSERYDRNLAEQRDIDRSDAKDRFAYRLGGQLAGGVGSGVALAKGGLSLAANAAQSGKGWMARLLGGAADGGIAMAAHGFGSGEDGARNRVWNAARNVPTGMALGTVGEGVATGLGNLAGRVFRGSSEVAPGANLAANVAEAQQFGIPLSRAQATRSVPQANIENQLRSQGAMQGFDDAQRRAVGQSVDDVQSRLANGAPAISGQAAPYDDVASSLRRKRDALKAASQDAYEASVNNPNVLVDGEAVRSLPDFIRGKLDADNILIDPMYHTGAARALRFVNDYLARLPTAAKSSDSATPMLSGPAGEVKSVDAQLRWIENLRAGLRKNFPPVGQDAPGLKAISSAIDDWTDDVFERGLVSGSDDVLQKLKTARSKWSEYKGMSEPRSKIGNRLNPRYEAQARVRSIMDKDMSPEEIGKILWGTSVASPKASAHMTALELRKVLGPDSPQWNAIRQSFWLRATRAGDQEMNPSQIAKNLHGFLKGDGKGVADVLFSEAERKMMTAYSNVMRVLSPAKAGLNGSNTANRLMPTLRKYASGIMGALSAGGALYGGLGPLEASGVGAIATTSLRGLSGLANASRASAAVRMPVPANSSGVGGAVLRGGALPMLVDQNKGKVSVFKRP
ncbi:hypothetical protein BFN67_13805 [Pseudaminobacter manganicus]|uniref:Uncharacterized protein n=2 Tax=Manganibacter manganicus TaxID=1873176 RepID=A0A1V8RTE4_9HYPH|nr:hypothetical protein BFN67_13805 [Pseudaminobacter manganicus]